MDISNNEENNINVVVNEPQKNEEKITEAANNSNAEQNTENDIKIEEVSSNEATVDKLPHDAGEAKPDGETSSEGSAVQETHDSKMGENEEGKNLIENGDDPSKGNESAKGKDIAEDEIPLVVVDSAKDELVVEESKTSLDTDVERIDHDQSNSTEKGTAEGEGTEGVGHGGKSKQNKDAKLEGGDHDESDSTGKCTAEGEGTEGVGHGGKSKQSKDAKLEGGDHDQSNVKKEENIPMNENVHENAGVKKEHVTAEDSVGIKEPETSRENDLENKREDGEPSGRRSAQKEDSGLVKTDENIHTGRKKQGKLSDVKKEVQEMGENEEKVGEGESRPINLDSFENDVVNKKKKKDAGKRKKKNLKKGHGEDGEVIKSENTSEEQNENLEGQAEKLEHAFTEHETEGKGEKADKEQPMYTDREQVQKSITENEKDENSVSVALKHKKSSSKKERSGTASSDRSGRRSARRSSEESPEERRLRDMSNDRKGKRLNESNTHFQDYLTRQVKEGKESEQYLKQKLEQKDHELEAAERKVKDLQLRLKRFVKDDKAKDERILLMEKELKDLNEKLNIMSEMIDLNSNSAPRVQDDKTGTTHTQGNSRLCLIL